MILLILLVSGSVLGACGGLALAPLCGCGSLWMLFWLILFVLGSFWGARGRGVAGGVYIQFVYMCIYFVHIH